MAVAEAVAAGVVVQAQRLVQVARRAAVQARQPVLRAAQAVAAGVAVARVQQRLQAALSKQPAARQVRQLVVVVAVVVEAAVRPLTR